MSADAYLIWFIVAAVVTNIVIYGGIVGGYLWDKRWGDSAPRRSPLRGQDPEGALSRDDSGCDLRDAA